MRLSKMTSQELLKLKGGLNLTEEEEIVFDMLSKNKSILEISERLMVSTRTVDNKIKNIKSKMARLE